MRRRDFLFSSLATTLATRLALSETLPLKFGHRQANMGITVPGPAVFEVASHIPGLSGVELQMFWKGQDLSDHSTALDYKARQIAGVLRCPRSRAFGGGENRSLRLLLPKRSPVQSIPPSSLVRA